MLIMIATPGGLLESMAAQPFTRKQKCLFCTVVVMVSHLENRLACIREKYSAGMYAEDFYTRFSRARELSRMRWIQPVIMVCSIMEQTLRSTRIPSVILCPISEQRPHAFR